MSLVSKNNIATNNLELTIAISAEDFEVAVAKEFKKQSKNIQIKGFRKGKAPRSVIEKLYGEGVFWDDALNEIYSDVVTAAIKEAGLEDRDVIAVKDANVESISKAEGVVLKVTVVTRPEVSLKEYKGLKATKEVKEVADEEVDTEIERRRQASARTITVEDRAAEMGDEVVFDFDGSVDGEKFEGGQASSFTLTLGSGQFIPGFEEQIVGHNAGEEFDVNVTFPEDYHAEDLAGKAAVFACKLHEIREKELPELDDEFAKDISEFDTLDELKNDIRTKLQDANDQAAESAYENALVAALIENLEAEIPAEMIENEVNAMMNDYVGNLQQYGLNMEMYMQMTGQTVEAMKETLRPNAESRVKSSLALDKIVELEGLQATEEEVEAEYEKLALSSGFEVEQVKSMMVEAVEDMKISIAAQKALELIKANAIAE